MWRIHRICCYKRYTVWRRQLGTILNDIGLTFVLGYELAEIEKCC